VYALGRARAQGLRGEHIASRGCPRPDRVGRDERRELVDPALRSESARPLQPIVVRNHDVRSQRDCWRLDSNQLLVKLAYAWRLYDGLQCLPLDVPEQNGSRVRLHADEARLRTRGRQTTFRGLRITCEVKPIDDVPIQRNRQV
jgi:hypothetical protein